jgi:flagellar secretion chaperone FliS
MIDADVPIKKVKLQTERAGKARMQAARLAMASWRRDFKEKAMFGSMNKGANAYASVGLETGVAAASPHKLIVMLFDGALTSLNIALIEMRANNVAAKGRAISKAIRIIEEGLRASLDKSAGGAIAGSLDSLYEYISGRLLRANLENRAEDIEEAQRLLGDLRGAWLAIDPEAEARKRAAAIQPPAATAQGMRAYAA